MKVLFVASELTPIAKVGGLGDVIGSLPKVLSKLGIDVKIIIPKYEQIDREKWRPKLVISNLKLDFKNEKINVYKTYLPKSKAEVFLIENKKYLSRGPVYFEHTAFAGRFKEIQRFLFFSRAVFHLLTRINTDKNTDLYGLSKPDVVHCNDWHTGALVNLLKRNFQFPISNFQLPKVVFTIHNLGNQGRWNAKEVTRWFGKNNFKKIGNDFNFIAEGILNADKITTVSLTYAKEILTKEYGGGLEKILRKRKKDLIGILNGIDYDFWPPRKNRKLALQRKLNLAIDYKKPLFGFIARLTWQKGLGLLIPIIPELVEKYDAQFVFLGIGERRYELELKKLARIYPRSVSVNISFDEKLAHDIYADSDFFLFPSFFESCGLGQMISMHYGTIPVVRETGGLKDTVRHLKTGFVFKEKTTAALTSVIRLAIEYFYKKPKKLKVIQKNCRKQNFSWQHSVKKYIKLYKTLSIY